MKKFIYRSFVLLTILLQLSYVYFIKLPDFNLVKANTFTTAYTTMTNSRFSYLGAVGATVSTGGKDVTIKTSARSDNDTGDLFAGDSVCFNNSSSNGCNSQVVYTVGEILNSSGFNVTSGVTGGLLADDRIVASQSSRLAIVFTPTDVTGLDHLRIYVPAAASNNADGIPDAGKFDANTLGADIASAGVVSISGGTPPTLGTPTYGTTTIGGATYHNIKVPITANISAGTQYTLTIGHSSTVKDRFINPAPSGTSHTRGVGDKMVITIQSEDSSNNIIDKADTGITPNDGVFVSAYVPTSVTWTISAVAASTVKCGVAGGMSVGTTADNTSGVTVPFGTIYNSSTFFDAAHTHTITTNAPGGYTLQVEADGPLTKSGGGTIANGTCDGGGSPCSTTVAAGWATATNNGFGYTLSGTNATFSNPNYKIFDTAFQTIASNTTTVTNDTVDICYRLSVGGTETAGLYYNKLTYQAYPKF